MSTLPVGIVGGGILGLAVGRELTRRYPGLEVVVFEKEGQLGAHQTGHNSGVVHAGIYYKPGSLKAELCTRGRAMLRDFCADRGLPYQECGKLVVAVDESELGRLDALEQTASANQVPGLRRIGRSGISDIEPHASGLAALHSPATAITDFGAVARAYGEDIGAAGGRLNLSSPVTGIEQRDGVVRVRVSGELHELSKLVICAGLQSDLVSGSIDGHDEPRIVPFRGEYMTVSNEKRHLVRGMVYPVPDPRYPFLGVHYTRRVGGELEVGPNAVLALKREGYRRGDFSFMDTVRTLGWPGFWRMGRRHWRTGAQEVWGSISKKAYMERAARYVPEIDHTDVERGRVGVRAQALDRDGSLVDDFRIFEADGVVSVRNAPSPAATSSLAIAEYVVDRVRVAG
jgi:L-2-hydroxyglutarate oxidase LhgO